jgi:hypothetical protein
MFGISNKILTHSFFIDKERDDFIMFDIYEESELFTERIEYELKNGIYGVIYLKKGKVDSYTENRECCTPEVIEKDNERKKNIALRKEHEELENMEKSEQKRKKLKEMDYDINNKKQQAQFERIELKNQQIQLQKEKLLIRQKEIEVKEAKAAAKAAAKKKVKEKEKEIIIID